MPFDGSDNTPALNRARLIEALRAEMPADYRWKFTKIYDNGACGTVGCAIGLAVFIGLPIELFPAIDLPSRDRTVGVAHLAEVFGISKPDAFNIFLSNGAYGSCPAWAVTPGMVADALERLT